ncbi:MAG: lipid-A-disaccharide synthase [Desulfobulbaceae bacterium]
MGTAEPPPGGTQTVMIVAGEASGDLHGARLVAAMREQAPGLRFFGMGGAEMAAAGVELLFDAARIAVVGLTEVFSHLCDILAARRLLTREMRKRRPDLLVVIDFPDFNLMLAGRARKLGIPVLYYVSPQVWAWRSGRVKKIGRLADRIAVILPFEKAFYARRGVEVDFVGHPLMDSVTTTRTAAETRKALGIGPEKTVIGILPGSRTREIITLLPDFLAAARRLTVITDREYVFLVPRANTVSPELLADNGIDRYRGELDIRVSDSNRYDLMAACDAAIAASGTVILELAMLGVPAVATYRVSPRTYFLGRMLTSLRHFTLVNLIGGRTIIPELLQDEVTPAGIARELALILDEPEVREKILAGLAEVREKLGKPGASRRAAGIALELMRGQP